MTLQASSFPFDVIVVVGPTASGKSALADKIAHSLGSFVLSADAMQVYKKMNIGTAKTPVEERIVPLLGIDLVDVGTPYSAALYQPYAREVIANAHAQDLIPVMCGGTGLYINAALDKMEFPKGEQEANPTREKYERLAQEIGAQALHAHLEHLDSASAALIHPNNVRRVIRALELHDEGISYAEHHKGLYAHDPYYKPLIIGLTMDRALLYERINARVDRMVEDGLIAEVQGLVAQGLSEALTSQQAIGYKEIIEALEGKCTLEEALEQIKQSSRRYAKRQLTWFRKDTRITWIDRTNLTDDEVFEQAMGILNEYH